jgi:hypothetical protein
MTEDLVKRARELAGNKHLICSPSNFELAWETVGKLCAEVDRLGEVLGVRSASWLNTADSLSDRESWLADETARASAAELSRDEWKQKADELSDQLDEAKQLEREMWKDSGAEAWAQYAIDLAKDRDEWKAKAEKLDQLVRKHVAYAKDKEDCGPCLECCPNARNGDLSCECGGSAMWSYVNLGLASGNKIGTTICRHGTPTDERCVLCDDASGKEGDDVKGE